MFGHDGQARGSATDFVPRDENGHPLPPALTPRQRAAHSASFRMEFAVIAQDGTRRWFEANGQPILGDEGAPQGGVVTIRDITERSLQRLQKEFLALASHELRAPLTPLQSYLQLLLRQLDGQPGLDRARRYTEIALTQVGRLTRLVGDLLDVTRLQTGQYTLQRELLRPGAVIAQAVEAAQTLAQGQEIVFDNARPELLVHGDADRLEQMLLNLLTNAITYAPGAARIDVRLREVDGEAEIEVQDYGNGIPASELPYVFSRFYQVVRHDHTTQGTGAGPLSHQADRRGARWADQRHVTRLGMARHSPCGYHWRSIWRSRRPRPRPNRAHATDPRSSDARHRLEPIPFR